MSFFNKRGKIDEVVKTRIPGFLLALACLTAVPATAQVNYAVAGNYAYVTYSPDASGNIDIASTYNGYPVTWIQDTAFYGTNLTRVTIGNNISSLEYETFENCTSLTNVTFGISVMSIGSRAFYSCTNLTRVTLPNRVGTIGISAFALCTSLTNVTLGSVTSL